jgi:hypothetical protein
MQVLAASGAGGGIFLFLDLVFVIVAIVAATKILSKAGYSPWFALLLLVPLVNFVMILVFAFSDWPVDKELRRYRQGGYGAGQSGYGNPPWPSPPPPPGAYGGGAPPPPGAYGGGAPPPPSGWPPPGGFAPPPGGYSPPPGGYPPPSDR